jgi:putative ABC transport system ATP-binding protein
MATALLLKDLRSKFAGPFNLELSIGACAAVIGPSGSGKSLLLRMIADLDLNEGEVWLNGQERAAIPAPEWRKRTIYVSAESGWWADTVIEHFARSRRTAVAGLAAKLGVRADRLDAPVAQLSTGEKQRFRLSGLCW